MTMRWVSQMNYNGVDFLMVQVDWSEVRSVRDRPAVMRFLESLFPGRHLVAVSRDPLKKDGGAEFIGHPQLIAPLMGHKITDFPWKQVKTLK